MSEHLSVNSRHFREPDRLLIYENQGLGMRGGCARCSYSRVRAPSITSIKQAAATSVDVASLGSCHGRPQALNVQPGCMEQPRR